MGAWGENLCLRLACWVVGFHVELSNEWNHVSSCQICLHVLSFLQINTALLGMRVSR